MQKIAVLPYKIDPRLQKLNYLSEGIMEELGEGLINNAKLCICSRSTVMYLQSNPQVFTTLKNNFEIDFLIEGRLSQRQNELILNTNCFETSSEKLILNIKTSLTDNDWISSVDEHLKALSDKLGHVKPKSDTNLALSRERDLYQQGLYHWNRYTYDELKLAIKYYKQAKKQNPNYALPYSGLADSYTIIGIMGWESPKEMFELANEAVNKTIILNNKRSESYASAAMLQLFAYRNFRQAKINFKQALLLNKTNANAHHIYSMHCMFEGEALQAEKHALKSLKLDPLSIPYLANLARIYLFQKKYSQCIESLEATMSILGPNAPLIELRAFANLFLGKSDLAIEDFNYCKQHDSSLLYIGYLAYALARANLIEDCKKLENELQTMQTNKNTGLFDFAFAIIKLGLKDYRAFYQLMNNAITFNIGILPALLLRHPIFNEIRLQKEYSELITRCNLEDKNTNIITSKKPSEPIEIESKTSESLILDPQNILLIKSEDNYIIIYWHEHGIIKQHTLRLSLKQILNKLNGHSDLYHCHKSFAINLNQKLNLTGNARALFIEGAHLPFQIPTSRTKHNEIKKLIRS